MMNVMNVVNVKEMRMRRLAGPTREQLEELLLSGSPVDLSVVAAPELPKIEIEQTGGLQESSIFELQDGRFGLRADIAVTNHTSRPIQVLDLTLSIGSDSAPIQPLNATQREYGQDKRGKRIKSLTYIFPGRLGLELPYDDVLNHSLFEGGKLPARSTLTGWVLAIGGLMPAALKHGQLVPVEIGIRGAAHVMYDGRLELWVERLAPIVPPIVSKSEALHTESPTQQLPITAPPVVSYRTKAQ